MAPHIYLVHQCAPDFLVLNVIDLGTVSIFFGFLEAIDLQSVIRPK